MKVIFSHGLESGPWGTKIQRLADIAKDAGCEVDSIDYTDTKDPETRANRLADVLRKETAPCLLVGSSMGGYVSLAAAETQPPQAMFLMAPAIYLPGYPTHPKGHPDTYTDIVHGWSDEIVPVEHSIKFAQVANCTLHLIDGDHRLIESLDRVCDLFQLFLKEQLN